MFRVITKHPIAVNSPDHLHPLGTKFDNSLNLRFNNKLIGLFPGKIAVLDLGCAGGGMVESFIKQGHTAIGLEGSDYSQKAKRAAWGTIPGNLFTCDVVQPFTVTANGGDPFQFDVVTAWEFFEHIAEADLDSVVDNVRRHLKAGGYLICSISSFDCVKRGIHYHQTLQKRPWWVNLFETRGFKRRTDLESRFGVDWVRIVHYGLVMEKV